MSIIQKTIKESIATWIMFVLVSGVMFLSIMVAIENAYSSTEELAEVQDQRYEKAFGNQN
ncbi:MAG: hypothetical protein WDZ70_02675 [Candidatus Paceibacterota bacterium]